MSKIIQVHSQKREEWIDITQNVQKVIDGCHVLKGAALLFVPHTTAAITINENADPDVREDINRFLNALVPKNGHYRHLEGNADAHIKSTLVGVSLTIPIENGKLLLGTWQGIYFCEFDGPRLRQVYLQVLPNTA